MGRGNWFSSIKKALSPSSKEKREQKSKKKWRGKEKYPASNSASSEVVTMQPLSPPPPPEEVKLTNAENEHNDHSHSVAAGSSSVVEAEVVVPAPVAVQVVQRSAVARFAGKSSEEIAAIRIQAAFRGYMSKRALRALRGLVRLKTLMEGSAVKRQAANTLRCMQTLARVQSQIRYRRARMSEDNQALQRQLLQKHAVELEKIRLGEDWDDSVQSKEQVEASLLSKHEATMRRERALAYAFSHQQARKNLSKSTNPMFVDPTNPAWGWSWLERWMAARPWESRSILEKDLNDTSSTKSASVVGEGEISRAYARRQLNPDKRSPKPPSPRVARKLKQASPKGSWAPDDDFRSNASAQSDRFRRHSIAGSVSSVRDDESLASSPSLPSYMVPTESARAKSRQASPADGSESALFPESADSHPVIARKRLSYPQSPARPPRRHSGPPKVDVSMTSSSNGVSSK